MTIIVWTPDAMAADRQSSRGDTRYLVRKLYRVGNAVVGLAGGTDYAQEWLHWYSLGHDPKDYPKCQTTDDYAVALVGVNGKCFAYDRSHYPTELLQPFAAIGCGREAALGALEMGATAEEAVRATCKWIDGCGGPIDMEKLR